MKNIAIFFLMLLYSSGIESQTVKIGDYYWTTKNLNVDHFNNGDIIMETKTREDWIWAAESRQPAWCYYEEDTTYGKVYNWYCVIDSRKLCPYGYHIPTKGELMSLRVLSPSSDFFAKKLTIEPVYKIEIESTKGHYESDFIACKNCSYWTEQQKANNPCSICKNKGGKWVNTGKYIPGSKYERKIQIGGWDGNNESGFSALPGPYISYEGYWRGTRRNWASTAYWSATEKWNYQGRSEEGYAMILNREDCSPNYVDFTSLWKEYGGAYVRCIRDN
jgi:uncharacterized protein (TIGR02145 family)